LAGDPVPYVKWAANSHKAAVCYTRPITKEVVKGINGKWKLEGMPNVQHTLINSHTAAKGMQKLHMGLDLCMEKMESGNTAKGFFLFFPFCHFCDTSGILGFWNESCVFGFLNHIFVLIRKRHSRCFTPFLYRICAHCQII